MKTTFYCAVWASAKGLDQPLTVLADTPIYRSISCNHELQGRFGINMRGVVTPFDALVPAGTPELNITAFTGNVDVVRIKDLDNGTIYYCDTTSYYSTLTQCNPSSSVSVNTILVTSAYTVQPNDAVIFADTSGGSFAITLDGSIPNRIVTIYHYNVSGTGSGATLPIKTPSGSTIITLSVSGHNGCCFQCVNATTFTALGECYFNNTLGGFNYISPNQIFGNTTTVTRVSTSLYNVLQTDNIILYQTGASSVVLPNNASIGKYFLIYNGISSPAVALTVAGSGTIKGATSVVLSAPYSSVLNSSFLVQHLGNGKYV